MRASNRPDLCHSDGALTLLSGTEAARTYFAIEATAPFKGCETEPTPPKIAQNGKVGRARRLLAGRVVNRFEEDFPVGCTFVTTGTVSPLSSVVEVAALRVTQEAMTNARRHSEATRVAVRFERHDLETRLTITDDGCGFDTGAFDSGYGLSGIRGRVTETGGRFTIETAPAQGTTITVRWSP